MRVLVIEDGDEYAQFARALFPAWQLFVAHSCAEALAVLAREPIDAMFIDQRFERTAQADLEGDLHATAQRLFGGDADAARGYLRDQQGVLVLAALRRAGHAMRALFVHDFPARRLANLRALYGDVRAVPTFDAQAIAQELAR